MKASQFTFGLLVTVVAVACSKSEAATDPAKDSQHAMVAAASDGPSYENDNYKVRLERVGTYKKGENGLVKVIIETKGAYHINKQYPYKFATQNPPADGVTYPKSIVPRTEGTFEDRRGELPVAFVASKNGEVKVGGTFSLSVCTDANCLMDKRVLDITLKID